MAKQSSCVFVKRECGYVWVNKGWCCELPYRVVLMSKYSGVVFGQTESLVNG